MGGIKRAVNFFKDLLDGTISIPKLFEQLVDALELFPEILNVSYFYVRIGSYLGFFFLFQNFEVYQ